MKAYDFAVVGGGIAGCLLAYELNRRGQSVCLFNDPNHIGSSQIAAGSINPITGRKFVKSWKIDLLLEQAVQMYSDFEKDYGIQVMHKHQLIRGLKSVGMQNDWSARAVDSDYANYINIDQSIDSINGIKNDYVDYAVIENAYRIDFQELINGCLNSDNNGIEVICESFNYNDLSNSDSGIKYRNIIAKQIVFCEGSVVRNNKLWDHLSFVPAHGERFVIHAPDLKLSNPFNDGKIIIPLGEDQYWVGSNYNWDIDTPIKTDEGFQLLKKYLDDTLTVPYDIINHAGHIRPATYNRRPFVGRHSQYSNYYILNGLGAKGASLAPYCVNQLVEYMLDNIDLDEEIDVVRIN